MHIVTSLCNSLCNIQTILVYFRAGESESTLFLLKVESEL